MFDLHITTLHYKSVIEDIRGFHWGPFSRKEWTPPSAIQPPTHDSS